MFFNYTYQIICYMWGSWCPLAHHSFPFVFWGRGGGGQGRLSPPVSALLTIPFYKLHAIQFILFLLFILSSKVWGRSVEEGWHGQEGMAQLRRDGMSSSSFC